MSKLRRSLLFIPGNNPGMIQNAQVFEADSIIFDLEDAVSVDEKDAARILVCQALDTFDFKPSERIVRINPMDTLWDQSDVRAIAEKQPDLLLVPKADEVAIEKCDKILNTVEKEMGLVNGSIGLLALIESAYGVERASEIVRTSSRIVGVLLGGEDYTADLEVNRTRRGRELFYARTRLANLCKAIGIQFIDTPYADVDDMEGLVVDTKEGASLGATGKAAINPRQIETIHGVFSPSQADIKWAMEVVEAFENAQKEGIGVFSLYGKMIDAPVVLRARNILKRSLQHSAKGGQDHV